MMRSVVGAVLGASLLLATLLFASEERAYTIVIKEHRFNPARLTVPALTKVKVVIDNQDATAEEFESYDLDREKEIGGGEQAVIYLGPLPPGTYEYFGEFHSETAHGLIVAQ